MNRVLQVGIRHYQVRLQDQAFSVGRPPDPEAEIWYVTWEEVLGAPFGYHRYKCHECGQHFITVTGPDDLAALMSFHGEQCHVPEVLKALGGQVDIGEVRAALEVVEERGLVVGPGVSQLIVDGGAFERLQMAVFPESDQITARVCSLPMAIKLAAREISYNATSDTFDANQAERIIRRILGLHNSSASAPGQFHMTRDEGRGE